MDNNSVVEAVNMLLTDSINHEKWEQAYQRYANNLMTNKDNYSAARTKFRMPKPMYAYSSITMASNSSSFDIRVHGQSVGSLHVKKEDDVFLDVSPEKAAHTKEYFHLDYFPVESQKWAISKEAKRFRSMFKDKNFGRLKSEEHRIENLLLAEFSKRLRADGKLLCNIQPVKLSNCFFQLTTPLKASTHSPSFSMNKKGGATGGGIDIMARIKHSASDTRLAIIELKDDNNNSEPQKDVMIQALSYATFIAHLLRSKAGNKWWNLFNFSGSVPDALNLDVVSLMPKGPSAEGCLVPIRIDALNVVLTPYTLYYEINDKGQITGFSGTLLNEIM